ncbi:MAG: FAD-dependent oxidoreductase [Clostridia bacterium]|nr:FAD-dependent oxidoreductase [Clostridia bacterium]
MHEIWSLSREAYPQVGGNIKCGVAVVGGGLTGVILAYLLSKRGMDVALFEANKIASGKSGRSTAKVTVAHGYKYAELHSNLSADVARKYAAANMDGLRFFRDHLGEREKKIMLLYSLYGQRRLMKEYSAMRECGIPCQWMDAAEVPLPFKTEGAIKLTDQYAIDPVRFADSLCRLGRFKVYENSPAEVVDSHLLVCGGHTITADCVAICTNYPTHVPTSAAPIKLSRKTSLAVKMHSDSGFSIPFGVMAYGVDGGYGYRHGDDPREIIISGETSREAPTPLAEERLIRAALAIAPDAKIVDIWTNNDTYTHDGLPYSGRLSSGIWVACGYSAWGMTNSAAMAIVAAEQISGHDPWYADVFSPGRNILRGGSRELATHMQTAVSGMVKQMSSPPQVSPAEIEAGHAAVVSSRGKRAGAYRDTDGSLHLVSLKCPHLGCELQWNPADKTWDCPCHGSRFTYTGECVSNPANKSIRIE